MPVEHPGFRSDKGRPEVNPYVLKFRELAPWTVPAEDALALRGCWRAQVGRPPEAPLLLEIGPGNGFFFRDLAKRRSDAAVVGVEIRFKRVYLTAKKAVEAGVDNVRVVHQTIDNLLELFEPGEVDEVFINHPDPWPKERHHKHRLIRPDFVERVATIVKPGGSLWLKSDFEPYGPLAHEVLLPPTWVVEAFTPDLHADPAAEELRAANIETNYERKKRRAGCRILLGRWRRT